MKTKTLDKNTKATVVTVLRAAGVETELIAAGLAAMEIKQHDERAKEKAALLTQADKARQLGVSRFTVRKLTMLGRLHPVELLPGLLRYRADELVKE